MTDNQLLERYFSKLAEYGNRPQTWEFYFGYLFDGIDFEGKSVLDIGGGIGRTSCYAACRGAEKVICLEPEVAGSRPGMSETAQDFRSALGLSDKVYLISCMFQDFDAEGQEFDIIVLHDSINHLDEAACRTVHRDEGSRAIFAALFNKLASLARPGAKLVMTDCSRHNIFQAIGCKNPFAPTIAWDIHQAPEFWAELLSESGFRKPRIRWHTLNRLGNLGRAVFGNRLAAYFYTSHFCLTMEMSR